MSATNRGTQRNQNDFYITPDYTIESLLNVLNLSKVNSFLEPCRGSGAIYNKVNVPFKSYCEILENIDYLKTEYASGTFSLIITNPPFSLFQEFLEKSLKESSTVWYLLRVNVLGSKKRAEWWQDKLPTHLLTLSARPSFNSKGTTDATEYAWFGWDYNNTCILPKGIHVLPYNK